MGTGSFGVGLPGSQAVGQEAVTVTCSGKEGLNSDLSGLRDKGANEQAAEEMQSTPAGKRRGVGSQEWGRMARLGLQEPLSRPHIVSRVQSSKSY